MCKITFQVFSFVTVLYPFCNYKMYNATHVGLMSLNSFTVYQGPIIPTVSCQANWNLSFLLVMHSRFL